jgi:hypothetical protein
MMGGASTEPLGVLCKDHAVAAQYGITLLPRDGADPSLATGPFLAKPASG